MRLDVFRQSLAKELRKRQRRALAMDDAGKTFAQIGSALGVSRQRAHQLVKQARDQRANGGP